MYDVHFLIFGRGSYGNLHGFYGSYFKNFLENLEIVLQECQDKNIDLNWEKFHFMVTEGIVLGHKIYTARLEVDQAKVFVIKTLMPPTKVKRIRIFLGHA